ncbi:MAG: hypothetical protein BV459_00345 [Thermoplasmata archaeon M11B2D]|nr:MAG: hypothetical protein BV459_00345 [Thermoplasmata archaeon M11B2D]
MNINQFKAELVGGGARPNLYKVILPFPTVALTSGQETRKMAFLCRSAALPSSTIGPIQVPFQGRVLPVPGDRTYIEWSLTVFNDTDFMLRDAFERWSNAINSHSENFSSLDLSQLYVDGIVQQLGRKGEVLKEYKMEGIWPSEVGQIDLAFDTNDTIEEFPVTLQVTSWSSNTTS